MTKITRTAHLTIRQKGDYHPALLEELTAKGYTQVGVDCGDWYLPEWKEGPLGIRRIERVGIDAERLGLTLSVLTNFQRRAYRAVADHPEWSMVYNDGARAVEACPVQSEYKALYVEAMRRVADAPAVEEIQLNDESDYTDHRGHAWACYCATCTRLFRQETGYNPPRQANWNDERWITWVEWRFRTWAHVYEELRNTLRETHPDVKYSMQFDPAVCLRGWVPWFSGVDIPAVADILDVLRVDPYHTYHSHTFRPDITFLTENIRYMNGAIAGKPLRVWTQGFTWPEFVRPLIEADGRWTAVLPLALGAEATTPFSYNLLQEIPPVSQTYEDSFRFDHYYEVTKPVQHVAVIQGWQTKTWALNDMRDNRASYDLDHFRPACYALRREHILYDHLWDRRLTPEAVDPYKALYLPRVSCLSEAQGEVLRSYRGGIVATTDTGYLSEKGQLASRQSLAPTIQMDGWRQFGGLHLVDSGHQISAALQSVCGPVTGQAVAIQVTDNVRILATLLDEHGQDTGLPAVVVVEEPMRFVYTAFDPLRLSSTDGTLRVALSRSRLGETLVGAMTLWAAADPPPVTLEEQASVGLEYFLGTDGGGKYVVTLANYYLEDGSVSLIVRPQSGYTVAWAYEAESRRLLEVTREGDTHRIQMLLEQVPLRIVVIQLLPTRGNLVV